MASETTIRPYGPGKFDTILDSYVWDVSMNGCDEEIGSVDEDGRWYGIMRHGSSIFQDNDPFCESLNDAERDLLTSSAGVICSEDGNGFVTVDYYPTNDALNAAWQRVLNSFEEA